MQSSLHRSARGCTRWCRRTTGRDRAGHRPRPRNRTIGHADACDPADYPADCPKRAFEFPILSTDSEARFTLKCTAEGTFVVKPEWFKDARVSGTAAEVMVRGSSYTVTVKATSLSGRTLVP